MQASSPRARDDRITGSACCDAVPHSWDSSPLIMPAVDRAQHRVGVAGVSEGALLGNDRRGVAPVLRVGGEAVSGERVCHHVHGGPHGALTLARSHARGERAAVLLPDVRRHQLRLFGPEPLHRLDEQTHEEIVPPLHQAELQLLLHAEVPLGRPAGAGRVATGLDPQVAAVDQALEVVARHVRVQREGGGDLCRGRSRLGAHVQEDVAPGRIAERGRHRGDGGAEAAVVRAGRSLGLRGDRSGAHGG